MRRLTIDLFYNIGGDFLYTRWAPDEPDNFGANCMSFEFRESFNDFYWTDGQCNEKLPSICEIGECLLFIFFFESSTLNFDTTYLLVERHFPTKHPQFVKGTGVRS